MSKKERVTVDFDEESYYLDDEFWISWDKFGEDMADTINDLLNEQDAEIKRLKKENQGLQFKIMDMLDFVKEKGTVTREEIKKWWNGDVE